jgi:hypothetical protein
VPRSLGRLLNLPRARAIRNLNLGESGTLAELIWKSVCFGSRG